MPENWMGWMQTISVLATDVNNKVHLTLRHSTYQARLLLLKETLLSCHLFLVSVEGKPARLSLFFTMFTSHSTTNQPLFGQVSQCIDLVDNMGCLLLIDKGLLVLVWGITQVIQPRTPVVVSTGFWFYTYYTGFCFRGEVSQFLSEYGWSTNKGYLMLASQ